MKCVREGDRPYPIPAHGGENSEVPDVYAKGCCRHFKIPTP